MATYQAEVFLFVEEYQDKFKYPFDSCAKDIDSAEQVFKDMLEDRIAQIVGIEFVEFDSNNPSHAAASFLVSYEADQEFDFYGDGI